VNTAGSTGAETLRRTVTIINTRGLHARAAARFVRCAEGYEADVRVARHDTEVSGRSIMGLMMLAAAPGCRIDISASGPQAAAALAALVDLVENRFDED